MLPPILLVAGLAVAGTASAAPTHLTDVQYMQAARCRALIAAPALGGGDTHRIDDLLKQEGVGREAFIADKADEMQREVARLAKGASSERRASLTSERDGVCQAYNGANTAAAQSGTSSR
jgi:hypothetical protein